MEKATPIGRHLRTPDDIAGPHPAVLKQAHTDTIDQPHRTPAPQEHATLRSPKPAAAAQHSGRNNLIQRQLQLQRMGVIVRGSPGNVRRPCSAVYVRSCAAVAWDQTFRWRPSMGRWVLVGSGSA